MSRLADELADELEADRGFNRNLDARIAVALYSDSNRSDPKDNTYARLPSKSDECSPGTYWISAFSGLSLRTAPDYTSDPTLKRLALAALRTAEAETGDRYLITKNGAYYRPNAQGYTTSKQEAGRFTLEEAIAHSHPNGPDGPRDGISYELDDAEPGGDVVERAEKIIGPHLRQREKSRDIAGRIAAALNATQPTDAEVQIVKRECSNPHCSCHERLAPAAVRREALPPYGDWLPDLWDTYLTDLAGRDHGWARLPATFRWHEFHERLEAAIRQHKDGGHAER